MNFIKNFLVRDSRQNKLVTAKNPVLDLIFVAAIILIAVISAMSLFEFKNLLNANAWVSHTYEVIGTTDSILYNVIDIETHQRGYLLTGNKSFLEEQTVETDLIHRKLTALASLTSDMSSQANRIKELAALINDRIVVLKNVQDLKDKNLLTTSEGLKVFYQGHAITDKIRDMCDTIKKFEFNLLQMRNATVLNKAASINRILMLGTLISIASLLAAYFLFSLQLRKRVQAEIHQKNLKSQLTSVIEGASDMIAAMDLNHRYFLFNKAYQDEFELLFNKKISVGMSVDEVLDHLPKQKAELSAVWNESLSGKEYTKKIYFILDNVRHDYEINSSVVNDDEGEILGAVHIIRNITEQVREQAHLKNEYEKLHIGMVELKIRNEKITLMVEMSDVMLACSSIKELCQVATTYCEKILSFSNGLLYIMHPSKNYLEMFDKWGNPSDQPNAYACDRCWALRLGRVHNAAAGKNDLMCAHIEQPKNNEILYLCVPLMAQNDIYGSLYLEIPQAIVLRIFCRKMKNYS